MKHEKNPPNTRKTFYAAASIFESGVSPAAKLVLFYLSRVANREGVCFPSVGTIAENCGYSPNTVRKAIAELEQAKLITTEPGFTTTSRGRKRCTSNVYHLAVPVGEEPSPSAEIEGQGLQPVQGEGAAVEGEINNNSNLTIAQKDHSFESEATDDLAQILEKLELDLYEDKAFSAMIEHVITEMYYADSITVKKRRIPQGSVRSVLRMLTIDHIDYVQRKLTDGEDNVTNGEAYLMACIYNAPTDCKLADMRFLSMLKSGRL